MLISDQKSHPRTIRQANLSELVGESVYWFCPTCQNWRTTEIRSDETVRCPVCGGVPDWKKHPPTLAYGSRFKRVCSICADGSPWRAEYIATEQRYGDFIEQTYRGLPPRTKDASWRYFAQVWKSADKLANYLLTARDAPVTDGIANVYTEQGLQRRYYDPRREYNVTTLSDLSFPALTDDGGVRFTDEESAEMVSFHNAQSTPFLDNYFTVEFLEDIGDQLERSIAYDFSMGATKRDIERKYGLTEQQVRTKVAHIAKELKNHEYFVKYDE